MFIVDTLSDEELLALLRTDPGAGWRVFIDRCTPLLLALIARADIRDRDEAMEVYVLVCERLSERQCARLTGRDPAKGTLQGWLAVLVRNVVVDWVRSRAGRRRLFGVVQALAPFDQRVFELYYWDDRLPTEIASMLSVGAAAPVGVTAVFEALSRIESVLTERHRADLLSLAARSRPTVSLDDPDAGPALALVDTADDPETRLAHAQAQAHLDAALAALPAEDAAIVRLRFLQGLSLRDTASALHLKAVTADRLSGIVARLEVALGERRVPVENV